MKSIAPGSYDMYRYVAWTVENDSILSFDALRVIQSILLCALSVVRRGVNSYRPVNRLPHEILGLIFDQIPIMTFRRTEDYSEWVVSSPIHVAAKSTVVTHVCHYWREIGLETPRLWSHISDCMSQSAASELFRRSKAVPLNVHIGKESSPFADDVFRSGSSRVHTLHWHVPSYRACSSDVPTFMTLPAPNLELLDIQCKSSRRPYHVGEHAPVLFNQCAPMLRLLVLRSIPWLPANRFPNLTHLCISHCKAVSLSSIIALLSGSPALEDIVLVAIETQTNTDQLGATVSLNNMRRFMIKSSCMFVWHLLTRLNLPADMLLHISEPGDCNLSFMRHLPPLRLLTTFTKLHLRVDLTLKATKFWITAVGPSSALHVHWETQSWQANDEWVSNLAAVVPIPNIEEFWVDMPALRYHCLNKLLQAMASLRSLVLDDHYRTRPYLLDTLSSPLDTSPHLLCPKLDTLRIVDAWTLPVEVSQFASTRRQYGHPLRHLIVEHANELDEHSETVRASLEAQIESVENRKVKARSTMPLPSVCTADNQGYWQWR
ncbi:hypothetical protein AcV5_007672 [Taiwanofungus camphoratus]|nr:hypothetical protein AcV5_007672 [Antrodia cinnamomea]